MNQEQGTRVALISVIIKRPEATEDFNRILHNYSDYVVGRMGIPYKKRNMNIISIVVDGPSDVINALSGKIGRLQNVTSKVVYGE